VFLGPAITEVAGFSAASGNAGEFHKFGLDAGILVNSKLGKKSELQMEFAFIQEGSQIKPDTTNNNNYYTFNLNYISLALLYRKHIHISVSKKPTDQMGFEAGLSYNVLAGYKYELKSVDQSQNITVNKSCFGGTVGLFYDISPHVTFGGRYSNSFTPVIPRNGAQPPGIVGVLYRTWNSGNNMVFQLYFAINFGKGRDLGTSSTTPPPAPAAPNE